MTVSIQIMSDLHLETHPSYDFAFPLTARHLALLGDIGHVVDDRLFSFFDVQLDRFTTVFFLLGNHEPWHLSFKIAKAKVLAYQSKVQRRSYGGKFIFLDQTRYDLPGSNITILGCTLFSYITAKQDFAVESRLVDFKDILHWTTEDHNAAHQSDLKWLNEQITQISQEADRKVVIFSHHSPSLDKRCLHPRHINSEVTSAFATDLSEQPCWKDPVVKAWAFGHTHFNFRFTTEDGKTVMTNQKGYKLVPQKDFDAECKLVVDA